MRWSEPWRNDRQVRKWWARHGVQLGHNRGRRNIGCLSVAFGLSVSGKHIIRSVDPLWSPLLLFLSPSFWVPRSFRRPQYYQQQWYSARQAATARAAQFDSIEILPSWLTELDPRWGDQSDFPHAPLTKSNCYESTRRIKMVRKNKREYQWRQIWFS